jgi:hypothetical protein
MEDVIRYRAALKPAQLPIELGIGKLSLEVKRLGREADHSPLSRVEFKKAWRYTSNPLSLFMAWCI